MSIARLRCLSGSKSISDMEPLRQTPRARSETSHTPQIKYIYLRNPKLSWTFSAEESLCAKGPWQVPVEKLNPKNPRIRVMKRIAYASPRALGFATGLDLQ